MEFDIYRIFIEVKDFCWQYRRIYCSFSSFSPRIQARYATEPEIRKFAISCKVTIETFSAKIALFGIITRMAIPTNGNAGADGASGANVSARKASLQQFMDFYNVTLMNPKTLCGMFAAVLCFRF